MSEALSTPASHPAAQPTALNAELLEFLVEAAASREGVIREAIEEIIDEYITEWLRGLRPLPYIPGLLPEIASRREWVTGIVGRLGAGVVVDAMSLAQEAAVADPARCQQLLPALQEAESLLIEASGVEPGPVTRSVMESGDCRAHALLIAALVAVRPARG